jgi:hypothetical protein
MSFLVSTQRLYAQALRQRRYTNLQYAILTFYKFCPDKKENVNDLKKLRFAMSTTRQNTTPNYQLLIHFLFFWFSKQAFNISWSSTANQWQCLPDKTLWFYLLRYNFLSRLNIYPFVPTIQWGKYMSSQTAILPWEQLLDTAQLPSFLEDYYELDDYKKTQLSFNLQMVKANTLSKRYNEVFFFRAHHYPTALNLKNLKVLHALSLVPLKQPYIFDDLATARYSMDARKKRMLFVFRQFFFALKYKRLITEYQIYWRIKEQFNLTQVSAAASFFSKKWQ